MAATGQMRKIIAPDGPDWFIKIENVVPHRTPAIHDRAREENCWS